MSRSYLGAAAAVGGLVFGLVVAFYFHEFRGAVSSDSAAWGHFGDYVGGTLNATFGLLAFLAVLYALHLQQMELRENRLGLQRAELLRAIQGLDTDLQSILDTPVSCDQPWIWGNDFDSSRDIKAVPLRTLLLSDALDWEQYLGELRDSTDFRLSIAGEVIQDRDVWLRANNSLRQLMKTLDDLQALGGDESLVSYYRSKYEIPSNRMRAVAWRSDDV